MAYDVFISFKNTAPGGGLTVDRAIAERLHTKLRDEGLNVFFSEKDLSTTAFMNEIYRALEEAPLLILIGTSVDHINSRWVMSEWQNFLGAMNIGKKVNGEIMTVLSGITNRDLPIELANFQSYDADDLDGAVDFAFKALGRVKQSESATWLTQEEERKRRDAEKAVLIETQKRMAAEQIAADSQKISKKHAAHNRWLKTVAIVLGVALVLVVCTVSTLLHYKSFHNIPKSAADRALDTIYDFNWIGDGFSITAYSGGGGDIVLPDTYNGYPVNQIGESAFWFNNNVTSITIPESVTTLSYAAFSYCESLVSISLPSSISSVDACTFTGCANLTSVTISDGIDNISDDMFSGCSKLESISIPDSVTRIGDRAFWECDNLSYANIPDGVSYIGEYAFSECPKLTSVTIPDSVIKIGDEAFYGCASLKSINIPDGVTAINDWTFYNCVSLTSITIPDSVIGIGTAAFQNCTGLESITIPESVNIIGGSAFYGCTSLKSINIPDRVTTINDHTFYNCVSLTSITIPDSVIGIGTTAFQSCTITVTAPHRASYYGYIPDDGVTWVIE